MTKEAIDIVEKAREDGIEISDKEAKEVFDLCERKMDIARIENREEYMPLLFFDEVLNYVFRRTVNDVTRAMKFEPRRKEIANG